MEKTAGAALIVIGVVAIIAAIVASGVKVRDIEIGTVPSRMRQGLLGGFGVAVALLGLMLIWDDEPSAANNVATVADLQETNNAESAESNGTDANATDPNAVDGNDTNNTPADENQTDANTGTEAQ